MLGEIKKRVISICYFLKRIHSGVTAYPRLQLRELVSAVFNLKAGENLLLNHTNQTRHVRKK